MKFVNTAELKNETNRILKEVRTQKAVLVTFRGHPCAATTDLPDNIQLLPSAAGSFTKLQKRSGKFQKDYRRYFAFRSWNFTPARKKAAPRHRCLVNLIAASLELFIH